MMEIATLLASAEKEAVENNLAIGNVKEWIARYLNEREEEIARFPDEMKEAHWDLLMADSNRSQDAMFVLGFFDAGAVTFVAGRGNIADVRDFAENSFPGNASRVIDALSSTFAVFFCLMPHDSSGPAA